MEYVKEHRRCKREEEAMPYQWWRRRVNLHANGVYGMWFMPNALEGRYKLNLDLEKKILIVS